MNLFKYTKKSFPHKGFTLIELLVTISIIGVLSSVSIVSLSIVKTKGRDARRLSDLKQIQNALIAYNSDHYNSAGSVPVGSDLSCENDRIKPDDPYWDGGTLTPLLNEKYFNKLPHDPVNLESRDLCYFYNSNQDGRGACVVAKMERTGNFIAAIVGEPDNINHGNTNGFNCGQTISQYIGFSVSSSNGGGGGSPSCGDGICEIPEDTNSCPQDCGGGSSGNICGNTVCDIDEDSNSCPQDCIISS